MMTMVTSLINIAAGGGWLEHPILNILLMFDGVIYQLVSYAFNLFLLMCSVNYNSIAGLASGLIDNLKAIIMVLVVYKLGVSLLKYMLNPDEAAKDGKKIVINIFITAALLISYNFVFSVFNELGMLIMGNPTNYPYTTLSTIADVTASDSDNKGLIMRFVFGSDSESIDDVGDFLAYSTASIFIHDYGNEESSTHLRNEICDDEGNCDFNKMKNLSGDIGQTVEYHYLISGLVGIYLVYAIGKSAIQIGIRMFKLLILQLLAPVAIITVIDGGIQASVFKKYVSKYVAVFLEAFIRMLTLLIVVVFVCKFFINKSDFFGSLSAEGGWVNFLITIILVVAAFKFAGDIPKFIGEIFPGFSGAAGDGKGGFGKFIGGIVGGGIGLASGLATGTLAGAVSGLAGGVSAGTKGKNVADFFKGQASNGANARNVAANARMAGGSLAYAGARLGGMVGAPQRSLERGKLAGESKTAMDNMIKALEDNYDAKINIDGQEVGLNRDIFKSYAYEEPQYQRDASGNIMTDSDGNPIVTNPSTYGFYENLSLDTKNAVHKTNLAQEAYNKAQARLDELRANGASADQLKVAFEAAEAEKGKYLTLKASADKKVDTDYNTKMIKDAKEGKNIKEKGQLGVKRSIETYDHVADKGFKTNDFIAGNSNTKKASDHYELQQDRFNNSASAAAYNRSNSRGGK